MYQGAKKWGVPAVLAAVLGLGALAGPAHAKVYNLRAEAFVKTMPDGRQVRMWGFGCNAGGTDPCLSPLVSSPGPELIVDPLDPNLTINLTNNLPEPVSIVIDGQTAPLNPTYHTIGPYTGRLRSLTHEAAAGGSAQYNWSNLKPGTFLYHSGSHLAVQPAMGLYGAVRMDADTLVAYPAVGANPAIGYDTQATFLFSEVDPALNDAVAGDPLTPLVLPTYGTPAFPSSIHFTPRYFLVNGEPFPSGMTHTYVGAAGSRVLLRFLNAGLAVRSAVVLDAHLQLVAEDGNPYTAAKTQYSLDLAAGKTMDAIGNFADGYYPIFDRRLGLTNADTSTGGMFAYLEVGPSHLAGDQATLSVLRNGTGTGLVVSSSLPGGINCGLLCDQHYLPGTQLRLMAKPDPGSVFMSWTGCQQVINRNECLVTVASGVPPFLATTVTATFAAANGRIGTFRGGAWYLDKGANGWQGPPADTIVPNFGMSTDIPVSADVNGDGFSEIGTFRRGQWYFDADNSGTWSGCPINGGTDLCLNSFGAAGDIPVTGDWDGNGTDEVGVFRGGKWYFDMDGSGTYDAASDAFKQSFGIATDRPVTGDWDGDGRTEIGAFRAGTWYIDFNGNGRWDGVAGGDKIYTFGAPTDIPVTLDWNADGKSEIGAFRPATSTWYLDNGSGLWEVTDLVIGPFGAPGDTPVTGAWR